MIKKCLACGFSILMLFSLGSCCGFDLASLLPEQTMDPLPTAIANRTIAQNSRQKLVWRKGQMCIRSQLLPSPGLVVGHGYVAYVNFLGGPLSMINQLDILEATSGTTLWQSAPFATHEDMAISSVLLYSKFVVVFRPCWPQGKCNTHVPRTLFSNREGWHYE